MPISSPPYWRVVCFPLQYASACGGASTLSVRLLQERIFLSGTISEMTRGSIRLICVWALLALLLSYSFDFECLLESDRCQQQGQIQALTSDLDDSCVQPGLLPAAVALLTTSIVLVVFAPVTLPRTAPPVVALESAAQPPLCVPLGLRAPPFSFA